MLLSTDQKQFSWCQDGWFDNVAAMLYHSPIRWISDLPAPINSWFQVQIWNTEWENCEWMYQQLCRVWAAVLSWAGSPFIQVLEEKDRFPPSCSHCQLLTGKLPMLKMPTSTDHRSVWPLYPQPVANGSLIKTDRPQFRGAAGQQLVEWPDRSCKREQRIWDARRGLT